MAENAKLAKTATITDMTVYLLLQNCILQDKIFLWRYLKQMSIAIG